MKKWLKISRIWEKKQNSRFPQQNETKEIHTRTHIDKREFQKQQEETVTYKGNSTGLSADFSVETLKVKIEWHDKFRGLKERNPAIKSTLSSKAIIQNRRDKEFFRQTKVKGIHQH